MQQNLQKTLSVAKRLREKQELRGVTLNSFINEEIYSRINVVTYSKDLTD
jgi:hypothetical protein